MHDKIEVPNQALDIHPVDDGYKLSLTDPKTGVPVHIATVHIAVGFFGKPKAFTAAIAAAFLMLHQLDDVIENLQPDGWDNTEDIEEAILWRAIMRTWLIAQGIEVPGYLKEPPIGVAPADVTENPE